MFKKIYFKKIVFALFSHLVLIVFWFQKRSFVKMINLILKEVKSTWFSFPYLMKFPCSLAAFGTKNFHIVHCSSIISKCHILFSLLTFLIFCLYFFLYFVCIFFIFFLIKYFVFSSQPLERFRWCSLSFWQSRCSHNSSYFGVTVTKSRYFGLFNDPFPNCGWKLFHK